MGIKGILTRILGNFGYFSGIFSIFTKIYWTKIPKYIPTVFKHLSCKTGYVMVEKCKPEKFENVVVLITQCWSKSYPQFLDAGISWECLRFVETVISDNVWGYTHG